MMFLKDKQQPEAQPIFSRASGMYLTSQVSKTQSRGRGGFLHPSQDPLQGETFTALQGVSVSTGMQQWKVWLKTQPQHFFVLVTISFFLKVFNLDWKFHTWSKPSSNFYFWQVTFELFLSHDKVKLTFIFSNLRIFPAPYDSQLLSNGWS